MPPPQPNAGAAYLYDRVTDTTTLVSRAADGEPAHGDVEDVEISADGRWLVYRSNAMGMSARPSAPGRSDVYLYEVATGVTTLVSHDEDGARLDVPAHSPTISGVTDQRSRSRRRSRSSRPTPTVARTCIARTSQAARRVLVSFEPDGAVRRGRSAQMTLNEDASVLAYTARGDSAQRSFGGTIYAYDTATGDTSIVSQLVDGVPPPGRNRSPALDGDGGYVAYISTLDVTDPDLQYSYPQVLAYRLS